MITSLDVGFTNLLIKILNHIHSIREVVPLLPCIIKYDVAMFHSKKLYL